MCPREIDTAFEVGTSKHLWYFYLVAFRKWLIPEITNHLPRI
jgi:hypothetical protein